MKVLIAGGSGLIGQALTKELIENDHEVYILSRTSKKFDDSNDRIRMIMWDARTTDGWGKIVNEVDAIVNLAGTPLNGDGPLDIWLTKKRRIQLLTSRLDSTKALLAGVRESEKKPRVFIQASAIGYYGPRGDEQIYEMEPPGDNFLSDVQVQAERASEEAHSLGMRRIIIRTGLVLDKNEGAFQYFKLQFSLFVGGKMGSGKQYYSWIHIKDEAAAIRFLLEVDDAEGPYNLTAPNPVTNKEFAKTLGRTMRRPSFFPLPEFIMRAVLGEISTVVLDGQRVIPARLQELGFEFQYPDLFEALESVA